MKKLLIFALLGAGLTSNAQGFQGSITWQASYSFANTNTPSTTAQYMPKEYVFKKKDHSYLIAVKGGKEEAEMLWLAGNKQGYNLNVSRQTWAAIPAKTALNTNAKETAATIIKTGETQKILGYECTRYIIQPADPTTALSQVYWMTNQLDGLDMKKDLANAYMGATTTLFHKKIDGMPLRIEITTPTITIKVEATNIEKEILPSSLFAIPPGFKELK